MELKTLHVNRSQNGFNGILQTQARNNNMGDTVRIVTCGRGIIILPDTDRTKNCTLHELSKALHTNIEPEFSRNRYYVTDSYNDHKYVVDLSPQTEKFLEFLQEEDLLSSEVTVSTSDDVETYEF